MPGERQRRRSRGGGSSSSPGAALPPDPQRRRRRRRANNNRPPVASGICVERRMIHFTHIPRIPLGTGRPTLPSSSSSRRDAGGSGAGGGGGVWPPPLPPPPVCFSPSGRYLFSGGHESGALLMWQFDYGNTGQVGGWVGGFGPLLRAFVWLADGMLLPLYRSMFLSGFSSTSCFVSAVSPRPATSAASTFFFHTPKTTETTLARGPVRPAATAPPPSFSSTPHHTV